MPLLLPEDPQFTTESERLVWERLRTVLGPDDVLIANLRLTDETKDHEVDLVVLMPDVGCLTLEVKGGSVWYDGGWWLKRRGRDVRVHPVDQARNAKFALREYVAHDPRWGSRTHVAWAHGVVTPYASFDDSDTPELPRWALHDRDDLASLGERVRDNAWGMRHDREPPTYEDVLDVADILTGRLPTSYEVDAEADERAATADRLTQEQAVILGVTRLLHRVEVRGGAGSGKTVLALLQAKELARGREDRPPQRVALLCYSIGLAEHLKRTVATWSRRQRPAFVGTFHEFGRQWGAPDGDRQDSDFWEHELPRRMGELATGLPDGQRFDAVVVDEAQDFADDWWIPVLAALRDEEAGGLYVFSDEHQRIFARFGRPRSRSCRSCSTTTCATPSRSTSRSGRWRRAGCVPAAATDRR
ncbi:NERD domain-containing protein/DEAD/DEAH box helicase [Nocardioides zeae]|uniref:NERD domain-containing protein/DEAD/DEAH box helicase n=1 Tax=Nocardioides imazamoxiresistens TaxID=3231893 RepID=A0ABU3PTY1_9ACTN|nr:NERD domain-containing protein/DEAD/DEAH box helicase [Nocardioides zeae]MDT9592646.1 NERD domain-containing protein/DEAD/DEAH box helicase [Nocardioides zeae]